jgi:D-galactosamine 6-phosphate deaminase/isomerase
MNSLEVLLALPDVEKARLGLVHTPAEIARQPACWEATRAMVRVEAPRISAFLASLAIPGNSNARFVFCGAGSSACIGQAVEPRFRSSFRIEADSRPTTDCVTDFDSIFLPGRDYVAVHFSRSGDSPESLETYRQIRGKFPSAGQIIITCSKDGTLAKTARADRRSLVIVLADDTNDQSLVMTSSVTSMVVAALGMTCLDRLDEYEAQVERLAAAGRRTLSHADAIKAIAEQPWTRAVFLGSGRLLAAAHEGQIKLTEMTEGQVMCGHEGFLAFRHGPKVVTGPDCLVIAFVSSAGRSRAYEIDLLRELAQERESRPPLVVTQKANAELRSICPNPLELVEAGEPLSEDWVLPCHVVVAQLLGLFKSLALGIRPDNPSKGGAINRVVQGVRIHDE